MASIKTALARSSNYLIEEVWEYPVNCRQVLGLTH